MTATGVRTAILLLCLACTYSLVKGSNFVTGIFFLQYQIHLGASASQASLAVGLSTAATFLGGPIYGTIYSLLGYKKSCLIASLFTGLGYILTSTAGSILSVDVFMVLFIGPGVGITQIAILSTVGEAFDERRAFAYSVLSTGATVIALILGPLVQEFVDSYSWRWSLRLLGAIILNALPTTLLSDWFLVAGQASQSGEATGNANTNSDVEEKISETEASLEPCAEDPPSTQPPAKLRCFRDRNLLDFSLLLDPCFVCYTISLSCHAMAGFCPVFYLVRYAQASHIEDTDAVWLLSIMNALYVVACPLFGLAATYCGGEYEEDQTRRHGAQEATQLGPPEVTGESFRTLLKGIRRSYVLGGLQLIGAFTLIIPIISESYAGFLIYAVSNGLVVGGMGALPITVLADLFGAKKLPSTLSFRALSTGIMILSVPPFIGYLVDIQGHYRPAQYVCCGVAVLSGIATFATQIGISRRHRLLEA